MNDFETDFLQERFKLARERLEEILEEELLPEELEKYFHNAAGYLLDLLKESSPAQETYEESYLNPTYAKKKLGILRGGLLSFVYYELQSLSLIMKEKNAEDWIIRAELFLEIYSFYVCEWQENHKMPDNESLRCIIYWFAFDYADIAAEQYIQALFYNGSEEESGTGKGYLYSHSVLYGFLPGVVESSQSCSWEADRDHREDVALILDKGYVSRKLEAFRTALDKYMTKEKEIAGPDNPDRIRFCGEQQQIWKEYLKNCCTSFISLVN